jgi:hypothetical protein
MDLGSYRAQAESFTAEVNDEYRRHYAGLKADFELERIYAQHASLFEREAVTGLSEAYAGTAGDERRRLRMLLEFAVSGYVEAATATHDAAVAGLEARLSIAVCGSRVGYRESQTAQANEPDAGRRAAIERSRLDALDAELQPHYRAAHGARAAAVRELGFASYASMCAQLQEVDLEALKGQTEAFLSATDGAFVEILERPVQRALGIAPDELRRSDLSRFFRAPFLDEWFPRGRLVACLDETLACGGIELRKQPGVFLDVEPRHGKSPRAFCAPVRTPGEVHLILAPGGGRDDFATILHEAGHVEHYAHVDPALPFEFRCLGDNAITESFAFLLQHLTEDPEWLQRRLGVPDGAAREIRAHCLAERMIYLRRYAGKLAYELELHSGQELDRGGRYSQLLGAAVKLPWPRETYLADVDPGFYSACYIRAWALETHLRAHLRERHGSAWFEQRGAWDELRELWREGQRMTPEELLAGLRGDARELDLAAVADDLRLVS